MVLKFSKRQRWWGGIAIAAASLVMAGWIPKPWAWGFMLTGVAGVRIWGSSWDNYLNCDQGCHSQQEHEKYCHRPESSDQT